jgi:hypothetical protein
MKSRKRTRRTRGTANTITAHGRALVHAATVAIERRPDSFVAGLFLGIAGAHADAIHCGRWAEGKLLLQALDWVITEQARRWRAENAARVAAAAEKPDVPQISPSRANSKNARQTHSRGGAR